MGRRRAAALLMKQRDVKGKPRGGASHACPRCGARTRVVDTRRQEGGEGVRRTRRCVRMSCQATFNTEENWSPL